MSDNKVLLEVKNLKKYFHVSGGILKAVDDVSFTIKKGETLGLVGESGCGKSTTGRTIIGLYEPTAGEIIFDGERVTHLNYEGRKKFARRAQIIFQDPYASLNPRMTVGDIIGEGIDIHELYTGKERMERIYQLLEMVGLNREHANRFPHEFSGGQRQRIGIARAMAIEPDFIIADEPISALDVSIQAQIVNLLMNLQQEKGLTYLFIAHDLSMVRHISDNVAVMYLGMIVEMTSSAELYSNPLHPYTQALLSAVPIPDPNVERKRERIILEGDVPSPINPPPGCRFRTRCKYAMDICKEQTPPLKEVGSGHFVACHLFNK
ncbi:oligopeptide transport system ATP-binding protein [Thermoanaerobacter uzonensis DSM 18761]|jgi:oligopeptide transport system ATP-binding protein|uniref:Oligopeptide transport system ATP-binding protein n=1 Tax=Thermoanaerobacter uzonensis DSM 18761 TaxID=1123369 RepID=A0A1M4U2J5_9THEO|nr:dipeptide ABC transporter ATP-binding protein [Thermoanaerobacter uzonensis]SHE50913.1 oligopeptide transport system ATP-binding protein [Thermoanaerobacter uzonensis DSM 18761]